MTFFWKVCPRCNRFFTSAAAYEKHASQCGRPSVSAERKESVKLDAAVSETVVPDSEPAKFVRLSDAPIKRKQ